MSDEVRHDRTIEEIEADYLAPFQNIDPVLLAEAMAREAGVELPAGSKMTEEAEARYKHYLMSIRRVLATPEGLEVITEMLRKAKAFAFVFQTNSNVYRTAALTDYANDILQDVALAGAQHYQRVTFALVSEQARDALIAGTK